MLNYIIFFITKTAEFIKKFVNKVTSLIYLVIVKHFISNKCGQTIIFKLNNSKIMA